MIQLEVIRGVGQGQEVATNAALLTIGRLAEHTIVIPDPAVSRHHGEIRRYEDKYQYRDLNSLHGTFLRRGEHEYPVHMVDLDEGDELVLGHTDNVIRVRNISCDPVDHVEDDSTVILMGKAPPAKPGELLARDLKALRLLVHFDSKIIDSTITTKEHLLRQLLDHIVGLYDRLAYAAIIEEKHGTLRLLDYTLLQDGARVRVSSHIIRKVFSNKRPCLFRTTGKDTLVAGDELIPLSRDSQVFRLGSEEGMNGICALVVSSEEGTLYLQIEQDSQQGLFSQRDVTLVAALASRVRDRIVNLELVRKNQRLNLNATLGVFAGMIGHDIKNYLFFGKRLGDMAQDTLGDHPGLLRGIERARRLAQSMKELTAPGKVVLKTFAVQDLACAIASEFSATFGDWCQFGVEATPDVPPITTCEDLLSRVVWNVVMNACHTAENRRNTLREPPWVHILVNKASDSGVVLQVKDNVGGIGLRTLDYMRRSLQMIRNVYREQEDLIRVVDTMSRMEGFTNSVGFFFTAVAVNDMSGELIVDTEPGFGTTFQIQLPERITELKKLLRF